MSRKIEAPWTIEQVKQLNDYQYSGLIHPYTCIDSWHRPLIATINGWECLDCYYTQTWAHDFWSDGFDWDEDRDT